MAGRFPTARRVDAARQQQMLDVGRRVREEREAAGLTQAQLARATGSMSPGTLSKVEQGDATLSLFQASRIAEVVDCTIDALCPVTVMDDNEEEAAE